MYMSKKDTISPNKKYCPVSGRMDVAAEEYLRVYNAIRQLLALTKSTTKEPTTLSHLENLQKILEGIKVEHDIAGL